MSSPTSATPTELTSTIPSKLTVCAICAREFTTAISLSRHITGGHKITSKEYYDMHLKHESEGSCLVCGVHTTFIRFIEGYHKYCSRACSMSDPELNKQRMTTRSLTYENDPALREKINTNIKAAYVADPTIKQKAAIKFKATLKANPEISVNVIKKRTETYLKNPHIRKEATRKRKETYAKNPNIQKQSTARQRKTVESNPHIKITANEKMKATLAANPSIRIEAHRKQKQTLSTPEAKAMMSIRNSISLRNFYNNLRQSSNAMPCVVYLVASLPLSIVKIGITTNLKNRMGVLKAHFGQLKIIKTVETTSAIASTLEIKMHKHFKNHTKVQPSGDGRTEFFDSAITDEAIAMLKGFEQSNHLE